MKLVLFDDWRVGVVRDSRVFDVTPAVPGWSTEWPPVFLLRLIADFPRLRPALEEAAGDSDGRDLDRVQLRAPVLNPGKILAAPGNYRRHVNEMGLTKTIEDKLDKAIFLEAPSSIIGPGETILIPPELRDRAVQHEAELAVVIGRRGKRIPAGKAADYIFGYTALVDITVRGREDRCTRKSYDTFTPVGPMLVTADEIPDPQDVGIRLWVNDEPRHDGSTRDMIYDVFKLVEYASSIFTLYPGDILSTGTPEGVGPVRDGDRITVELDYIGRMSLSVRAGS